MLTANIQHIIAQIAALSKETGAAILSYYDDPNSYHVQQKDNHTPLTDADLHAHRLLTQGLPQILPLPCRSEESPSEDHATPSEDYWLIDPIDGTREFIQHTGEFCILIARIQHGRPILSFTYAPLTEEYWFAIKNHGAYKVDSKGQTTRLHCRPRPAHAPTVILARRNIGQRMAHYLAENFPHYQLITKGSGLKFCALAEGQADLYPKLSATTSQWDVAAGDLLLHEAGGEIRFSPNQVPIYGQKNLLNPPFLAFGANWSPPQIAHAFQAMDQILHDRPNL